MTANSSCQCPISDKTWPKMSRLDQVPWSSRAALTGPLPVVLRKQCLLKLKFHSSNETSMCVKTKI